MRYNDPIAYLITFTCYGTWLHGDVSGSVSRKDVTAHGWPRIAIDEGLLRHMRSRLRFPALVLDDAMRQAVESAIYEVCEHRGWCVTALNVRCNHVHVVAAGRTGPEKMLGDFKAYATRRLRCDGLVEPARAVWTDGGSTRYLWNKDSVDRAVDYVLHGQ